MPDFLWRAADQAGQLQEGRLQAGTADVALRQLRDRGLTPVRLSEVVAAAETQRSGPALAAAEGPRRLQWFVSSRVTQADVLAISSELAIMLRAGLSLDKALRVLIGMSHKPSVAALLERVLDDVKGGAALSRALSAHQAIFGDFYISMVRSGEASGRLGEVLGRLVEHLERMRELRESVVSATTYPAILLVVAVLSLVAMLGFVVPQFESLFRDMGDALPVPTRIVLNLGNYLTAYGSLILVVVAGGGWLLRKWMCSPRGRHRVDGRALRLPFVGRLILKYEIVRFARSFGTLLSNGVPILSALGIATETVGNSHLRMALDELTPKMKSGGKVADAIAATGMFEPLALNLIRVGEETGRLDSMMLELARILDRDFETGIKRGLTILEPVLILVLGMLIATIIVSILMGILAINDLAL